MINKFLSTELTSKLASWNSDNFPHGFWIVNTGEILIVPTHEHYTVAYEYCKNHLESVLDKGWIHIQTFELSRLYITVGYNKSVVKISNLELAIKIARSYFNKFNGENFHFTHYNAGGDYGNEYGYDGEFISKLISLIRKDITEIETKEDNYACRNYTV